MNKWLPIETYSQIGKKALFIDAEDFVFVGEGRQGVKGLEFWDFIDVYEPVAWFLWPEYEKSMPVRSPEIPRSKKLNKFNPDLW